MKYREVDILIGGMDLDVRTRKILWITIPYTQDDQTWCVAIAKPLEIWRNVFNIYTSTTWLALIGAIFFIASLLHFGVHLEKRHENYIWSSMNGLAAAIGQLVVYEPKRTSIRVLLIFILMYGMVMTTSFNSFLISILTSPRFKSQIDSVSDAIKSEMSFAGGEVAFSHFTDNNKVIEYFLVFANLHSNHLFCLIGVSLHSWPL